MDAIFKLPDEVIFSTLFQQFPCREHQIRSLASLTYPNSISCRNIILYGAEATGKSAITDALLSRISEHVDDVAAFRYVRVDATQCITARHLFERIIGSVTAALRVDKTAKRCETLAQLAVSIGELLADYKGRFVLVLDGIDRQRDAPPTLLPALARLSEMNPCLTTVFIVTSPPAGFLRTPSSLDLQFPPYSKQDFVRILSLSPPEPISGTTQQETTDLWTRFCAAVHDSLIRSASRTLPSFVDTCAALWPRFTAPILAGTYTPKEFSKLLVAARVHFQDESILNPTLISFRSTTVTTKAPSASIADLTALLPTVARILLLSAYLASHNATRHDMTLFSTHHHGRKRRRGGTGTPKGKQRKIARKLLGSHAFVLERMMAIFEAVRTEWVAEGKSIGASGVDGDVGMALGTLASLRLLMRVGAGDVMDRSGKWRINIGWEAVRGIGRSIGVDIEEWLIE